MDCDSLPKGWRLAKLGELGEVNRGRSRHRPRYAEHLYGGPYPFVQTGDIKNSGGRLSTYHQTYSEVGLAQSRLWPKGTMCITIAANIAETAILSFPACFPDSVVGFIADQSKCDLRFIEYTFRNLKQQIQHEASGSVQDNINLATLDRLRFALPPLPEQRAIAHILGTLDDKIELNRRMSETLEAIARALFQSWFVDFDPVRAKSEGRDTGLPKPIADLFPDEFEESELGEIPKGWKIRGLDQLAKLSAITEQPAAKPDRLWEHYSIPAYDEGCRPKHEPGLEIKSNKYRVPPTSILVSKLNPQFPRVWLPDVADEVAAVCSTEFMPFVPLKPTWRPWLYALAISPTFQAEIVDRVTGSTGSRQRVTPSEIAILPVVSPPAELIERFSTAVHPAFKRNAAMLREVTGLSELRDALIPKLMSGELRINGSARIVERATR